MNFQRQNVELHDRTIIHLDLDCFYAQVEMIKNPVLYQIPLGIQQKNIVVTSNYVARDYGVKKCMLVSEAKKLCPDLHLIKGEDLHDYRQISYKVTSHLQSFSPLVERLGLDENFIDVSNLVQAKLKSSKLEELAVIGHVFGTSEMCDCGCEARLKIGTQIAKEIRDSLKSVLNLTSCAGVAHNKILAKLCGGKYKPNQQTVVFPLSAAELLITLNTVGNIPGIGQATSAKLNDFGIKTVEDLQNSDHNNLKIIFGSDKAKHLWNLSFGCDASPVKQSAKPVSIGLEDSCKPLQVETEIQSKFQQLLTRLMILVAEDGRIPRTIKLTVRKFDAATKIAHRETKQCNVNSSLFKIGNKIEFGKDSEQKLLKTIMFLFSKIVDLKKPFHVTLLGLSFTKFHDRMTGNSSITAFLKKNVEVQSMTNIESKTSSSELMDYSATAQNDFNTDGSESELEPSPKKCKISSLLAKKHCLKYGSTEDIFSPSKLRVADLRLNSIDFDNSELRNNELIHRDSPGTSKSIFVETVTKSMKCPPNVDKDVFKELPMEVQEELWNDHIKRQNKDQSTIHNQIKKPKLNSILNYLVKN